MYMYMYMYIYIYIYIYANNHTTTSLAHEPLLGLPGAAPRCLGRLVPLLLLLGLVRQI